MKHTKNRAKKNDGMIKSASIKGRGGEMPFAGFDTHKNLCQAIICTKDGALIKRGRIKTETESIKEFFSGFDNLEIALEATSNSEYFYDLLESLGHKVVLAHPLKTRMIGEAKVKTDKIDARILADLLRGNLLPTSYVPPKERYYGRITKEGSKYLRWILVEAARIHVQWCPESKITRHYEKIKAKRGENIATVAAARKLLQVIYHMLKKKEEYRIGG